MLILAPQTYGLCLPDRNVNDRRIVGIASQIITVTSRRSIQIRNGSPTGEGESQTRLAIKRSSQFAAERTGEGASQRQP